jgi:UDP-3-O-[3-hydroxymyristoyl] N-acetylglucosamine deacetylase
LGLFLAISFIEATACFLHNYPKTFLPFFLSTQGFFMSHQAKAYQHTVRKAIHFHGAGLHSGQPVHLAIRPAPENSGIRFHRSDLPSSLDIRAHMDKIVDTRLATTLGSNGVRISTTEHLMAALFGFGIDNAIIDLDGSEVPIMDGSAGLFMRHLMVTGKRKQKAPRRALRIKKEIVWQDGASTLRILPHSGFKVSGKISFDDEIIKTQQYSINLTEERFAREIAPARTFGYVEQVEALWENGLALGGNLNNVIAIHWNRKSILNEDGLRFHDEFIRHKVLDLIGDLALLGCPVLGHVIAHRAGHTQHLAFMRAIMAAPDCWEMIEMNHTGTYSALHQVLSNTKAAGDRLMPIFTPVSAPVAINSGASC